MHIIITFTDPSPEVDPDATVLTLRPSTTDIKPKSYRTKYDTTETPDIGRYLPKRSCKPGSSTGAEHTTTMDVQADVHVDARVSSASSTESSRFTTSPSSLCNYYADEESEQRTSSGEICSAKGCKKKIRSEFYLAHEIDVIFFK